MLLQNLQLLGPGAVGFLVNGGDDEEADAGLVESAAEHEVHTEVTPEQQEKLMQQQDAGAETDGTEDNSGKES